MSAPAAGPPDFSTGFWKEFRLQYPRPAAYLPAAAAYCALFMILFSLHDRLAGWDQASMALAIACTLGLSVVPALAAARRFQNRARLAPLRALGPWPDRSVLRRFLALELAQVLLAPALTAAILLPLYLATGYGLTSETCGLSMADLLPGAALWLDALVALALSGLIGAAAGLASRGGRAGTVAVLGAVLAVVARLLPGAAGAFVLFSTDTRAPVPWLAGGDALVCLLAALLIFGQLPELLAKRLSRSEAEGLSDAEALEAAPEGLGLGIAFWALLTWRFRQDPLWRAEKKSFWRARNIACLWLWQVLAMALALFAVWFMALSGNVPLRNRFDFLERFCLLPVALAANLLGQLAVWVAPAVMAVGISAERRSGALDGLLLSPVAPLRLAAAKLLGRCWHLVLAGLVFGSLLGLLGWCCGATVLNADRAMRGIYFPFIQYQVTASVLMPLAVLAWGALGLYCAARWRSLPVALAASYGLALLLWMVLALIPELARIGGRSYYFHSSWGFPWVGMLGSLALELLVLGAVLRCGLVGAARLMALRRNE